MPATSRVGVVAWRYIAPDGIPFTAFVHVPPLLICHWYTKGGEPFARTVTVVFPEIAHMLLFDG